MAANQPTRTAHLDVAAQVLGRGLQEAYRIGGEGEEKLQNLILRRRPIRRVSVFERQLERASRVLLRRSPELELPHASAATLEIGLPPGKGNNPIVMAVYMRALVAAGHIPPLSGEEMVRYNAAAWWWYSHIIDK